MDLTAPRLCKPCEASDSEDAPFSAREVLEPTSPGGSMFRISEEAEWEKDGSKERKRPAKKPKFDLKEDTTGADLLNRIGSFLGAKPDPLAPLVSHNPQPTPSFPSSGKIDVVEVIEHELLGSMEKDPLAKAFGLDCAKKPLIEEAEAECAKKPLIEEVVESTKEESCCDNDGVCCDGKEGKQKTGKPESAEDKKHIVFSDDSGDEGEDEDVKVTEEKKKALFKALLGNLDPETDPRVQLAEDSDDSDDEDECAGDSSKKDDQHVEMEVGLGIFDVNGSVPGSAALCASGIVEVKAPGSGEKEEIVLPERK